MIRSNVHLSDRFHRNCRTRKTSLLGFRTGCVVVCLLVWTIILLLVTLHQVSNKIFNDVRPRGPPSHRLHNSTTTNPPLPLPATTSWPTTSPLLTTKRLLTTSRTPTTSTLPTTTVLSTTSTLPKPTTLPTTTTKTSTDALSSVKTETLLTSSDWLLPAPNHTYGDGTCLQRHSKARLTEILQRWIDIATRHNITYMLTYGSLLAAWRDGSVTPWDTDLDIYTLDWDNAKIDAIQDKRNFDTTVNEFHLVLDVDWRILPVIKRRRVGCNGILAPPWDSCTFNGPLGRLIKGWEQYLDIWDLEVRNNGTQVHDRYGPGYTYNWTDIFPLRKCTLLGLQSWCPRNPEPIFDAYYGKGADRRTPWVCKNKTWHKVNR